MEKEEEITADAPRVKRKVKNFGTGGLHVTLPKSVAKEGDKVLIINLNGEDDE